jgi:hypothetical protein
MHAIEFQTIVHDGVLQIPIEHRRELDGRDVRVVVVDTRTEDPGETEPLLARLRRVRVAGPADLSADHDAYAIGTRDA